MAYRIRLTETASATAAELNNNERAQFDEILEFLALLPFPIRGSSLVRRQWLYGRETLVFADHLFPYRIFYTVEVSQPPERPDIDGWIDVVFLLEK